MKHWTAVIGTLTVLGLWSGIARADVTAEQVWQNWQSLAASTGQTYTAANVVRTADTLTLQDVAVTARMQQTDLSGTIDEIAFRERGDGTVDVTLSPSYQMAVESPAQNGGTLRHELTVTHDNLNLIASGRPDLLSYDFTADRTTVSATGPAMAEAGSRMETVVTAETVTGSYLVGIGTQPELTTVLTADRLSVAIDAEARQTQFDVAIEMQQVTADSLGGIGFLNAPASFLTSGQNNTATIGYSDLRYSIETATRGSNKVFGAAADAGTVSIGVGVDGLRFAIENTGLTFSLAGPEFTFPQVTGQISRAIIDLSAPIVISNDPSPFALRVELDQLSLGDELWNAVDPGRLLSRDPGLLTLDISGKGNWLADLGTITETPRRISAPIAELHELELSGLRLSAGGAELVGTGAFTFDNDNLDVFRGFPAPEGIMELGASGANALIDNLVTLRLIPAHQAFFARVLAAPFLEAGDGPDTLQTRIEVLSDGTVKANGRPIR